MKAEFELTIDPKTGQPAIKFRHYDKSSALEQRLLQIFLMKAKNNGIELKNPSGYIDTEGGSWENYEIKPKADAK